MRRHLGLWLLIGLTLGSPTFGEVGLPLGTYPTCLDKCRITFPNETEDGAFCRITCNNEFPNDAAAAANPTTALGEPPTAPPSGLPQFGQPPSFFNDPILLILMVIQSFQQSLQPRPPLWAGNGFQPSPWQIFPPPYGFELGPPAWDLEPEPPPLPPDPVQIPPPYNAGTGPLNPN
jgi:hypothetical protein